jgi:thioredoxin 1
MAVIKLTTDKFDEVIQGEKVLVDFYADWCGPCRMQGPIVDELAEENADITACKVNVDDEPAISDRFGIVSIPTLLVFKKGQLVAKFVGVQDKATLLNALK